ncbi:sensor histidine kinase [Chitinophaga japonensis]|nr:PAS domain-containing sensor histidine kinase [Chitinophaga japonensis]
MQDNKHHILQNIDTAERYRLLIEQVKDYAIFMLDEGGHVISWNEGAQRIKGYAPHEILGKHFSVFYPAEDISKDIPGMELRVVRQTGKFEDEGWRLRKDGSRFWANVLITAVYNERRQLIGFSKVTRDLTERKKAEQALQDSEERYRSLAMQLNRTVQALATANEELQQFNSIVSHDLQEPLRTTYSYLLLIRKNLADKGEPEQLRYIERAILATTRMRELIISLLNYALLGTEERIFSLLSVEELVSETLHNLRHGLEEKNAVVQVNREISTVTGNKVRLLQLLQNLVSNAIKFSGGKTPEITISCREEPAFYLFSIADKGIGIAPEYVSRIFEVFRRLHPEKEYPGTGIGLSICKKIVEYHAGNIWVESVLGEGSVFYFTISKNLLAK